MSGPRKPARQLTRSQLALDWVRHCSSSKGTARVVLMILALYTNDRTGAAYPSATTVAREAGVDERAVFRALKSLVKSGELEIVAKRNHQPTLYRIAVPTDEGVTRDQQPTDENVTSQDEPTDVFAYVPQVV